MVGNALRIISKIKEESYRSRDAINRRLYRVLIKSMGEKNSIQGALRYATTHPTLNFSEKLTLYTKLSTAG
jgi:hypothetical protein